MFHGTKIPLQKWFLSISLILNAKKSLSSCQLSRDLDLNQKTAWYILTRIRAEMANKTNPIVLQGIIEADETYIGGKPRKENKKEDRKPAKRGRGTSKTAVIGAVERGGQVVAEVAKGLTGRAILEFIRRVVNVKESELMTDEYHAYNALSTQLKHHVINHQEQYVDGDKHTRKNNQENHMKKTQTELIDISSAMQWTRDYMVNLIRETLYQRELFGE